MRLALHGIMVLACWLGFTSASIRAQNTTTGAAQKVDPPKSDAGKPQPPLDKIKLPPGTVVMVVETIKDALSLRPNMVLLAPEQYKALTDRLAQLEKQLKADKKSAHSCKMTGRLEGDFVVLRAELAFTTDQPNATVFLGLQGAHLTDEGELDRRLAQLDFSEDGYVVKVEKEGTHQLVLNLKAPVGLKRVPTSGGAAERGFDLGLPGAAVTTLSLELPGGVKEVRWNENTEKSRTQNRWELALGKLKQLTFSWKEPVSLPGSGPLLTADSQVAVKIDETHVLLAADMVLEDLRSQTKEWQLVLPTNAKVDVKAPSGLTVELIYPEGKNPHHVLRLSEPSGERLQVHVEVRYPRPLSLPRLQVGPFLVQDAYRQQGTILVQAAAEALRGQRLTYYRFGETYQRDLEKTAVADAIALFQFWNQPTAKSTKGPPPPRYPLEIEWKAEKTQLETRTEHSLRLRPGNGGWIMDATTKVFVKAGPNSSDGIEIQLPRLKPVALGGWGQGPIASFPANIPWAMFAYKISARGQALPLEFLAADEGTDLVIDAQRRARLKWARTPGREEVVLVVTGKYIVPAGTERLSLDLPQPIGVVERGGKVIAKVDEQFELLTGAAGAEAPSLDKHQIQWVWDNVPPTIEIAWKPSRAHAPAATVADITLAERHGQVRQALSFPLAKRTQQVAAEPVRLQVPSAIRKFTLVSGGRLLGHEPDKETAWIVPSGEGGARAEVALEYDFPLPRREDAEGQKNAGRLLSVPLIWPVAATQHDAKVRVWCEPGAMPVLAADPLGEDYWKDRGTEKVAGNNALPALVVRGAGLNMPLTLRLTEPAQARLATVICERGLIQAILHEEGGQTYRARYLVSKLSARFIDLEFPLPAANCVQSITLDSKKVPWTPLEPSWNIARVSVDPKLYSPPVVLEVEYQVPASFSEGKGSWQSTLYPPEIKGDSFLGKLRWSVDLPPAWVGVVTAGQEDLKWGMQGWLLGPEPSVTTGDLEAWLTGAEPTEAGLPFALAFWRTAQQPVHIAHPPRQLWLVACSSVFLALGLALTVVPLSRFVFWSILLMVIAGLAALAVFWPGWLPAIVLGCQPGALVLLILLAIQWMLQESYRRQVVFMPSFSRLKANSSMVRGGSRTKEPSTVDAAPPAAASASASASPGPAKSPSSTKGT